MGLSRSGTTGKVSNNPWLVHVTVIRNGDRPVATLRLLHTLFLLIRGRSPIRLSEYGHGEISIEDHVRHVADFPVVVVHVPNKHVSAWEALTKASVDRILDRCKRTLVAHYHENGGHC